MNNKPKYNLFKNTKYALDGFICAFKNETSFKLEIFVAFIILPIIFFTPFNLYAKTLLVITYILILIVELLNSAIENVVDLVTKEIEPLAKNAKDIAATAVMISISLHIICWIVFGIDYINKMGLK